MSRPLNAMQPLESVRQGALLGVTVGELFLLLGLVAYGDELFGPLRITLTAWILVRSAATFALLGALCGGLMGGVLHLIVRRQTRRDQITIPLIAGIFLAATILLYLTARTQIDVLAGLPLTYPGRLRAGVTDLLYSLPAGGIAAFTFSRRTVRRATVELSKKVLPHLLLLSVALLLLSAWALRLRAPLVESPSAPRKVAVIGVDAATLTVMGPMIRAGELPTFAKLSEEGAWGTFLTFGAANSAIQWTTMATGKKAAEHGITDFTKRKVGTAEALPVTSHDRAVPALWNIVTAHGKSVGVVDWLMAFPPEKVRGFMVSRLQFTERVQVFPPGLAPVVESVWDRPRTYEDPTRMDFFQQIDRAFDLAVVLNESHRVDCLLVLTTTPDAVQHAYWKHFQPDSFDPITWDLTEPDVEQYGTLIPETYRQVDHNLGRLLQSLDENTIVLVVSDHGQQAADQEKVWFRLDALLAVMGELAFQDEDAREVDFTNTRAYSAVASTWAPSMEININEAGREPGGVVNPHDARLLRHDLADRLRSLRLATGERLFGQILVTTEDEPGRERGDIIVQHSKFSKTSAGLTKQVEIAGKEYPLLNFLERDTHNSGAHTREGVIFISGKGVRRGYVGQTVATTAFQYILKHLTDKVAAIEHLLPPLRWIGMIDRASTLDVTPTALYALGLPVAKDMSGRPLSDIIAAPRVRWVDSYGVRETGETTEAESEPDEEMLRKLRALGYIR